MKALITVDEVKTTRYTLGPWDFYTRQVELDQGVMVKIQMIEELYAVSQRALAAAYNTNGKFILPEDLRKLECVRIEYVDPTQDQASAKPRKQRATAAASSSE